ncbi:dATP pyrophosphohydrolase [Desulfomicrobium norvegicum]|uniref:dATP pyrophosphohydrolase n=1 Tax=Desulfomicrobium norvegicum (strain DSM 1741 / NCIMB 8310) TaxID=52561 RepID=A0A8G2F5Y8_DESNO|nr:NUDIX domain-containing protein [Desulfomicrobium norvegicum]SFL70788.1 dATP pyrophosphohydrolase [Desulfomicrobium norvegicum]
MIKYSIECWLYNDLEDRFLLLRCPVTHRHDEYWQPVTGGRGPDEPCIEACLREVLEETGVTLSEEQLEVVIPEFSFCIPDARIELRKPIYLARVRIEQVVLSAEHIGYYWFDARDVDSQLHWDSNRESFRQVLAHTRS